MVNPQILKPIRSGVAWFLVLRYAEGTASVRAFFHGLAATAALSGRRYLCTVMRKES